jgi:hypothetical protein
MLNYTSRPGSNKAHQPGEQPSQPQHKKLKQGKKSGNQVQQLAYQKYSGKTQGGAMGRRTSNRNHSPLKNNSI